MAARHEQQQVGRLQALGQADRQRVRLEVMHGDERHAVHSAIALPVISPTMSPPIRPGPAVAATASRSAKSTPASRMRRARSSRRGTRRARARRSPARRRRSGRCCSHCVRTMLDRMRPRPSARARRRRPPSRRSSSRCRERGSRLLGMVRYLHAVARRPRLR